MHVKKYLAAALLWALGGCSGVENPGPGTNEQEVITTVILTFTPSQGGPVLEAAFRDPDGDGGAAPTVDAITLENGESYAMEVSFLDELEDPAEDITEEVSAESAEHQVFFTGDAVTGPATGNNAAAIVEHAYDDADDNGHPVGLTNVLTAIATGAGELVVTLRHVPEVDGNSVKTGSLATTVADEGLSALPGDTDATVTFEVTVQ